MYSEKELHDIGRRSEFYKKKEVARYLLAHGVPKTKGAMLKLMEFDNGTKDLKETLDCLRSVSFVVHPQQINIWDKSNGKLIISIPK
jgi:hypothetical protein